jgi:hypothetical protein
MLRDSVNYKPKRGGWCRRKTYLLQFIEKKQQIEGKDEKMWIRTGRTLRFVSDQKAKKQ